MQWLELTVKTVSEGIDTLAENLTAWGFDSFLIDDSSDFQQFLEDNTAYWDYVDEDLEKKMQNVSQIRLYLECDDTLPQRLSLLQRKLAELKSRNNRLGSLELCSENLPEEDWANSWKKNYQPIPVGEKLLVTPYWIEDVPADRIVLKLDPGLTFGTGAHETTQMCMLALQDYVKGGERAVDLGSGSGILSIAALLLGAKTSVGIDIDPKAEDIARENAALNGFKADRFSAVTGNVISDRKTMEALSEGGYDIVLANIVADVIISMTPVVPRFLRKDAVFICSGILDVRAREVEQTLVKNGLTIEKRLSMGEWRCFCAKRK
ncbi:MAG: 50S ribosomal protein L11 methyltransferase [Clostridia bacterium]|nr:50S ribosomal protein L11 methyltransferase [Clostridia bacterium]